MNLFVNYILELMDSILDNNYIVLFLAALILWICWRMTLEGFTHQKEHYGNGAMGPYAISTGAQSFATRPGGENCNDRLQFRYLNDLHNW
jgi:hypothetical protein